MTTGVADDSGEEAVTCEPPWTRLRAVREDRAHPVEDDVSGTGTGPTTGDQVT